MPTFAVSQNWLEQQPDLQFQSLSWEKKPGYITVRYENWLTCGREQKTKILLPFESMDP